MYLGLLKILQKEISKNQEHLEAESGPLHRTWATTACVANSLLSIFVQYGCLTWPRFALGKDTSLQHSPAMKMYEQHLTLPYFYSPRALTSVKGEGKGGGG